MALVVRPSRIHSVGVFTNAPVRKGTRLIEYTGKFLTPDEADGKKIIDGEGIAAYLNHSCDPNCEIDEIKNRAYIFALRDIAAGEELLWDYNLYDDDDPAPCHCGSAKCRGTMYSREWMAKLRRKAARKEKSAAKKREGNHQG
jgi:hypothetical protein